MYKTFACVILILLIISCVALPLIFVLKPGEDSAIAPPRPDIEGRIQEAELIGANGDHEKAIQLLEKMRSEQPDYFGTWWSLIREYIELKQYSEAIPIASQMIEQFPDKEYLLVTRARLYMLAHYDTPNVDYVSSANADILDTIAARPEWLELYLFKALTEVELCEQVRARETIALAETLAERRRTQGNDEPSRFMGIESYAALLYMLGLFECADGKYKKGNDYFQRVMELENRMRFFSSCQWDMAVAEALQGQYEDLLVIHEEMLEYKDNQTFVGLLYQRLCLAVIMNDPDMVSNTMLALDAISNEIILKERNRDRILRDVDFGSMPSQDIAKEYLRSHFATDVRDMAFPTPLITSILGAGQYGYARPNR